MATCVMINRDPDDSANIQVIGPFTNRIVAMAYRDWFVKDMIEDFKKDTETDGPGDIEDVDRLVENYKKDVLFDDIVIEDVIEPH